jgi:hypothetical protein
MVKRILLAVIVVLILIQFFRPQKNIHPGAQPNALSSIYPVPADVDNILKKACNDCHSNNTRYPWYNNMQPVAWLLNHHVNAGKREFNFDEFSTYPLKKQNHKLEELVKEVKEGDMPLSSYTIIHTDARLSDAEKKLLTGWADSIRYKIKNLK